MELLERMPLSFKERGIWFGDNARALELSHAPSPQSLQELRALDEAEREAYFRAWRDVVRVSGWIHGFRDQPQEWVQTFGLSPINITSGLGFGGGISSPLEPAYIKGNFDAALVHQRLIDLGYESREAGGRTYYAHNEDYKGDLRDPVTRLALSSMNRVYIDNETLVAAPATDLMVSMLEAWAGAKPSLADDPGVKGIASSFRDPLSAAILTRESVFELPGRPLAFDRQPGWGPLHDWELFGAGYEVLEGRSWLALSLYYEDPAHADADAGELVRRIQTYSTIVPQIWPEARTLAAAWPKRPYDEICGPLTSTVNIDGAGSILTVRCPLGNPTTDPGMTWLSLLEIRDLGFLAP